MNDDLKLGSINTCCCGCMLLIQMIKVFVIDLVQYCLVSVTLRRKKRDEGKRLARNEAKSPTRIVGGRPDEGSSWLLTNLRHSSVTRASRDVEGNESCLIRSTTTSHSYERVDAVLAPACLLGDEGDA